MRLAASGSREEVEGSSSSSLLGLPAADAPSIAEDSASTSSLEAASRAAERAEAPLSASTGVSFLGGRRLGGMASGWRSRPQVYVGAESGTWLADSRGAHPPSRSAPVPSPSLASAQCALPLFLTVPLSLMVTADQWLSF